MNPDIDTLISLVTEQRDVSSFQLKVGEPWYCDSEWVFSGMIAAIAGATASAACDGAALDSCDTTFLRPTRAGAVQVDVRPLRGGRAGDVLEVVASQCDALTAVSVVRMSRLSAAGANIRRSAEWAAMEPAQCRDISWVTEYIPVLELFEERAIAYPESAESFHTGSTQLEIWARARDLRSWNRTLESQLYDIVLLDSHVLQPVYFDQRVEEAISEDFHISWVSHARPESWTYLRTECGIAGNDTVVRGELRTLDGFLRAVGMCRGRLLLKG